MRNQLLQMAGGAHALAIQILGDRDDAADAVQDAFTKVLSQPGRYQSELGPLRPWFMQVVRNRCLDMLRRRRNDVVDSETLGDHQAGPEGRLSEAQQSNRIQKALNGLPAEKREIIVLRDFLDMSYSEIATVLNIAPGTVMSRIHRARMSLKKELQAGDRHE